MRKFLLLDTSREPSTVAVASARKILAKMEVVDQRQLSERLLARIDELSESAGISINEVTAIGVVSGPGPFTALRIGAAVANALGYAHDRPIVAVTADEAPSLQAFAELVAERAATGQTVPAVLPDYGREPSITLPK